MEMVGARSVRGRALLPLVVVFIISFAVPVLVGFRFGKFFLTDNVYQSVEWQVRSDEGGSAVLPAPGRFLRIAHASDLDPQGNFLLIVWVKLKVLPEPGDRVFVVSKFDNGQSQRPGYAVALEREGDHLKPMVYWSTGKRRKSAPWFAFDPVEIKPQQWTMIAVTNYDSNRLGLFWSTHDGRKRPDVRLGGGYELDATYSTLSPRAETELLVGALGRHTRGVVGPVTLVQTKESLRPRLKDVLKDVTRNPLVPPRSISNDELRLWVVDGRSDLGSGRHTVSLGGGRGAKPS